MPFKPINSLSIRFWIFLPLLWIWTADTYSDERQPKPCQFTQGKSRSLKLRRPPGRVLLIPLLSRDPHTTESPRWSEQPARTLEAFYRNQLKADVTRLRDVWSWSDYYRLVEQLLKHSPPFDRVMFISHGGFDGPVLKNAVYDKKLVVSDGKGELLQYSEAQPGLNNVLSITYHTETNPGFSDYMALHWDELASMKTAEIWPQLKALVKQLEPLNQDCFQRYCSADVLATSPEHLREYRIEICESICRRPLFQLKTSAEISPERFFHFTNTLKSLVTEDGLIFFGTCNPGSAVPARILERDETEYLINTALAGGPHRSYVHLVSSATGRTTAGPIGQSSAEDIVNRVIMFENGQPQRHLCLVGPAANY